MKTIFKIITIVLVALILPITTLAQSKPRITSPSDRSSSVLGNDVNVRVSGNNIEVIYAGLTGSPNPSNSSEDSFYKGTMYQSGSRFFFTPNTSAWENKWVKIIAHDKIGGGWSDPVYVKINPKPQPNPTPPAQPQYSTSRVNDYRWTIQNANVYSDWDLTSRKTTLNKGTKVYVSEKYIYSNGNAVAKINEGYVNANDLGTAEPTPTQQNVNEYRWIIANPANVYNDWNLTSRKTTLNKGTKVYVSYKYILSNGNQVAKINEGYVNANDLGTAEPVGTGGNSNTTTKSDYSSIVDFLLNGTELACKISGADYIKLQSSAAGKIFISGKDNILKTKLKLNNGSGYYNIDDLSKNTSFSNAIKVGKVCRIINALSLGKDLVGVANEYKEDGDWGLAIIKGVFSGFLCCASAPLSVFLSEITKFEKAGEIFQNYSAKDFITTGNAVKRQNQNGDYIGDINANSGFKVNVDLCCTDRPLKICIFYASDARGGKLKVNGIVQNINFPSTNWIMGQQYVSGNNLKKGINIIEFYGGYNTPYAPDIYLIRIED